MAHATSRFLAAALSAALSLALTACATTSPFRLGARAEQLEEYDRAIVEYTKALRAKPDHHDARVALDRAKLRASQDHFNRGRRLIAASRSEEALVELQLALELNPANGDIDTTLRDLRTQLRAKASVARDGKTPLQTLVERARTLTADGFDFPGTLKLADALTFRDAPARNVFIALARMGDVNVNFDQQFRDAPITIDIRDSTLESALQSAATASHTFYRVTGPRTVTISPDTPAKRREYEDEIVRSFYISNADLKETIDLLRIVIDAKRIAPVPGANMIAIKDTPERVAAAGRLIAALDKAKPEVVIDVELLEVDRTRLREYGLQVASPGSPGIDGAVSVRDNVTLRNLRNLTQSDVSLTNLPGLFYRVLKQDSNTRTLANPQIRATDGATAQAQFGERVPIPVTQFAPIGGGGLPQQPITSYNYANIGVNIDITPRAHHDDAVTLALKVEVSSLSGSGFGGLPTFANRSINTVIRLRDGETNLFAGLIRDDERRVVQGIPGLSDIPGLGRFFAHTKRDVQETDIILTLTPHLIRVLDVNEEDLRPFRIGRDAASPAPAAGRQDDDDVPALLRNLERRPGAESDQSPAPPPSDIATPILPPPARGADVPAR